MPHHSLGEESEAAEYATQQQSALPVVLLARYSAWQEVYSIDESFLGLAGDVDELTELGRRIRADVAKYIGLPVCVGIASSKTLAKVANKGAKKHKQLGGVVHWDAYPDEQKTRILDSLEVDDLWGVASRTKKRLAELDVHTARELRDADPKLIRKKSPWCCSAPSTSSAASAASRSSPSGPRRTS